MSDELTFFEKIVVKQLARIIQLMKSTDEKPTELQLLNREKLEAVEQEILHREENVLPENPGVEPEPLPPLKLDPDSLPYFANLENVMVLEISTSGKAYRILKEGFEVYLALSHIDESMGILTPGKIYENIELKSERGWVLKRKANGVPNLEWKVYEP